MVGVHGVPEGDRTVAFVHRLWIPIGRRLLEDSVGLVAGDELKRRYMCCGQCESEE